MDMVAGLLSDEAPLSAGYRPANKSGGAFMSSPIKHLLHSKRRKRCIIFLIKISMIGFMFSLITLTSCSLNLSPVDFSFNNDEEVDSIHPIVHIVNPGDMDVDVGVTIYVSITFSVAMDRDSIEAAFSLMQGTDEIEGEFSCDKDMMIFRPLEILEYGKTYDIIMGTGAKDTAGNNMASDFDSSFTTAVEPDWTPPNVGSVSPADSDTDIPITTNISVTFSEQMDTGSVQSAFSLSDGSNEVSGTFSWSGDTMTFNPSNDLGYSTLYYVTVDTGAMDTAGNNMASDFNSSFTTGAEDSNKVTLAWDPNTEPDLAGYIIYYGHESRNYLYFINVGNQLSCTIADLQPGETYYFSATAYNTSGAESDYSIEVIYSVPL
jgi:type IV pilus assembly protein PilY1